MRLPGGENVELPWHGQHVVSHARTKRLQMPILRTVEAELTVKALVVDLWWRFQKDHPRKTASMGMGGVVVASSLTVEPNINHLQLITTRHPGSPALWRLTPHHMSDPAVTGREHMRRTQLLNRGMAPTELSLLAELTSQLCGSVKTGVRMSQHIGADAEQLIQQRLRQVALENGSREKIEDLQGSSKNCCLCCQQLIELTVHSDENCLIAD